MCLQHQHFQPSAFRSILTCFIIFSVILIMLELMRRDAIVKGKENIALQDVISSFSTGKIEIYDSEYY